MTWTRERILDENARWVWVPEGADEVRSEEYHLIAYPPHFVVPTQVAWCRSERPSAEVVGEVLDTVRGWERPDVSFWVDDRTRPTDLVRLLEERGAARVESVEVLALGLDGALQELAPGIEVRQVLDAATLGDADLVSREVWGDAERPEGEDAALVARLADPGSGDVRMVAYVDGEPACAGGMTLAGDVARMWGGATRPHLRGRGAYRSLLGARMQLARERGATVAMVRGITTTSAPILRALGFECHGVQHRYQLPA